VADLFAVKELLGHKDVKSGAEGQKNWFSESDPEWTKKDAVKWEIKKRAELERALTGTTWLSLPVRYLDHAIIQFIDKTTPKKTSSSKTSACT
jgi:hypothetical protein